MRYRIALCGFSEFEYRAMHFSFQHPATPEETAYDVVDALADADFAVVDADSKPAVKGVLMSGRLLHSVFVGATAPPGSSLLVPRPIDPPGILRLLEALAARFPVSKSRSEPPVDSEFPTLDDVVQAGGASAEPAAVADEEAAVAAEPPSAPPKAAEPPAPVPWDVDRFSLPPRATELPVAETPPEEPPAPVPPAPVPPAPAPPAAAPVPVVAAPSPAKAAARAAARRARLANTPAAAGQTEPLRDVLVLDADEAAGQSLADLLELFGFSVHPVRSISRATEQLAKMPYAAIFLDIALDGADHGEGLALFQRIQDLPAPEGHPAPALLIVTAHLNPADRVRAALAGIKTPLIKPVTRGDVARALESCDVTLPSDARRGAR